MTEKHRVEVYYFEPATPMHNVRGIQKKILLGLYQIIHGLSDLLGTTHNRLPNVRVRALMAQHTILKSSFAGQSPILEGIIKVENSVTF